MIDASKLLAFANKLEDDYKEQGYKWLYDKLRYEIVRQNQTELNNNEVLDIVSGCFYWVKHTENCEYEPAIAECRYEKGVLYFCFTCGGAVKCGSVVDHKKLNYR